MDQTLVDALPVWWGGLRNGGGALVDDQANRSLFALESFSDGQMPASGNVLDLYHPEGDITFARIGTAVECDKVDNPFTSLGYTASLWQNHLNNGRGLITEQSYTSLPDRIKLAGATDWTVEWYEYRGASNSVHGVFGMWDGTFVSDTGREWLACVGAAEEIGLFYMDTGGQKFPVGSSPIPGSQFAHIAVCVSGGTMQMWQNGTRVYNAATTPIRAATGDGYFGFGCTAQGVAGANNAHYPGTVTHQPRLGPVHIWKGFAKYDGATITPDFPTNPA